MYLHLGVVLSVDADEGGGAVESGHEGHRRRRVELSRSDDCALKGKFILILSDKMSCTVRFINYFLSSTAALCHAAKAS